MAVRRRCFLLCSDKSKEEVENILKDMKDGLFIRSYIIANSDGKTLVSLRVMKSVFPYVISQLGFSLVPHEHISKFHLSREYDRIVMKNGDPMPIVYGVSERRCKGY